MASITSNAEEQPEQGLFISDHTVETKAEHSQENNEKQEVTCSSNLPFTTNNFWSSVLPIRLAYAYHRDFIASPGIFRSAAPF